MATGQLGRRYMVELFDVRTFAARPRGVQSRDVPDIRAELAHWPLRDVVIAEMRILLMELRRELGADVGVRLCPLTRIELSSSELLQAFREAVPGVVGECLYTLPTGPIAVHQSVLTAAGELQGTTAQAER